MQTEPPTHHPKRARWNDLRDAAIAATVAVAAIVLPGSAEPRGTDRRRVEELRAKVESPGADTVLVGDSMLGEAVDAELLAKAYAPATAKLSQGGSASAYWYLVVKNVVIASDHRPRRLVLFFRDHFLTYPTYRVLAPYRDSIESLATGPEELLDRLAFEPIGANWPDTVLGRLRALRERERLRREAEGRVKACAAALVGATGTDLRAIAEEALARTFADDRMRRADVDARQFAAESLEDDALLDFDAILPRSFLPEIVRLCRERGIELVCLRVKRRRDLDAGAEPEDVRRYLAKLGGYLDREGVRLVDFTGDPRIELVHYGAGDHLNAEVGRPFFTGLLAETLVSLDGENPSRP